MATGASAFDYQVLIPAGKGKCYAGATKHEFVLLKLPVCFPIKLGQEPVIYEGGIRLLAVLPNCHVSFPA